MTVPAAIDPQPRPRANRARIRLYAWGLGALALFFYLGYFAWQALRGPGGA